MLGRHFLVSAGAVVERCRAELISRRVLEGLYVDLRVCPASFEIIMNTP